MLGPGDAERIAEFLGVESNQVDHLLLASPGAKVFSAEKGVYRIGTIVPDRKPDGSCIFFGADERCEIHSVAPFGCAFFDDHMSQKKGDRRSKFILEAIDKDEEYKARRARIELRGRIVESPEALRKQKTERDHRAPSSGTKPNPKGS